MKNPDAILTAGRSYDAVIRVYDKAGNMIETLSAQALSKSGKGLCAQLH